MLQQAPAFQVISYVAKNGKNYYDEWITTLTGDIRRRVLASVNKMMFGIGLQKNLGEKLWELKIDIGLGYRAYFYHEGNEIILLLSGSNKKAQQRTIKLCRKLIKEIEEDKKSEKGRKEYALRISR